MKVCGRWSWFFGETVMSEWYFLVVPLRKFVGNGIPRKREQGLLCV